LYQLPVFTETFCDRFCDELANFNAHPDLPKERPNTMNRYGVLLDEIGFSEFFNTFRADYMQPIAARLFPAWSGGVAGLDSPGGVIGLDSPGGVSGLDSPGGVTGLDSPGGVAGLDSPGGVAGLDSPGGVTGLDSLGGVTGLDSLGGVAGLDSLGGVAGLDSHRAFTVKYGPDIDQDLGFHYDNAEVTINIALNSSFEGSEIYFCGMFDENLSEMSCIPPIKHRKGWGILHRGRQFHGALPILSGFRENLIVWMRCSKIRNLRCPMCHKNPELIPASDFGDGFKIFGQSVCKIF